MGKVNAKLGTDYQLFNYYGAPDADRVIVAMGSICDVAKKSSTTSPLRARRSVWLRYDCSAPWQTS